MECELELGGEGEPIGDYACFVVQSDESRECYECGRPIESGAVREIVTGEFEDEDIGGGWHTCMDCVQIAKAFQTEGRDHGMLWTQLEDCGGPDGEPAFEKFNSGCLRRIESASAKVYLQQRYRKWAGLA